MANNCLDSPAAVGPAYGIGLPRRRERAWHDVLSPGDPHDVPGGRGRMQHSGAEKQPIALVMERAFEGDDTRSQAQRRGYQPVVPPKFNRRSPWQYDGLLYRQHNEIEKLLRRLKRYRHVFTRDDT